MSSIDDLYKIRSGEKILVTYNDGTTNVIVCQDVKSYKSASTDGYITSYKKITTDENISGEIVVKRKDGVDSDPANRSYSVTLPEKVKNIKRYTS